MDKEYFLTTFKERTMDLREELYKFFNEFDLFGRPKVKISEPALPSSLYKEEIHTISELHTKSVNCYSAPFISSEEFKKSFGFSPSNILEKAYFFLHPKTMVITSVPIVSSLSKNITPATFLSYVFVSPAADLGTSGFILNKLSAEEPTNPLSIEKKERHLPVFLFNYDLKIKDIDLLYLNQRAFFSSRDLESFFDEIVNMTDSPELKQSIMREKNETVKEPLNNYCFSIETIKRDKSANKDEPFFSTKDHELAEHIFSQTLRRKGN